MASLLNGAALHTICAWQRTMSNLDTDLAQALCDIVAGLSTFAAPLPDRAYRRLGLLLFSLHRMLPCAAACFRKCGGVDEGYSFICFAPSGAGGVLGESLLKVLEVQARSFCCFLATPLCRLCLTKYLKGLGARFRVPTATLPCFPGWERTLKQMRLTRCKGLHVLLATSSFASSANDADWECFTAEV